MCVVSVTYPFFIDLFLENLATAWVQCKNKQTHEQNKQKQKQQQQNKKKQANKQNPLSVLWENIRDVKLLFNCFILGFASC